VDFATSSVDQRGFQLDEMRSCLQHASLLRPSMGFDELRRTGAEVMRRARGIPKLQRAVFPRCLETSAQVEV
jgi:hypothetical protein